MNPKLTALFALIISFFVNDTGYLLAETQNTGSVSQIADAAACKDRLVTMQDLVIRGGIFYEKFSDKPFCGEIKKFGRVLDGKRDGKWTVYHANGQLNAKVFFVKGEKTGVYEQFNKTGATLAIGHYKKNRRFGAWLEYERQAKTLKISNIGHYSNGRRDGEWTLSYKDNRKCSTRTFVEGKTHGKFKSYFPDGELSLRGETANGVKVGIWEVYHLVPPHHLCAKGDFNLVKWCQFNRDGEAESVLIEDTRPALLKQIEFIQLWDSNSCIVRLGMPSELN